MKRVSLKRRFGVPNTATQAFQHGKSKPAKVYEKSKMALPERTNLLLILNFSSKLHNLDIN